MRHLIAIPLASLAFVACGSAGDPSAAERTASTEQAIVRCQAGYYYSCNKENVCSCVKGTMPPPTCNFAAAAGKPDYNTWIESWAAPTTDGQCPDRPGNQGTWKQLSSEYAGRPAPVFSFDGVPNESMNGINRVHECSDAFGDSNCCTYVWWPDDFVVPTGRYEGSPGPQQDPQALCVVTGVTFIALEIAICDENNDAGLPCILPGGGSCGTCASR